MVPARRKRTPEQGRHGLGVTPLERAGRAYVSPHTMLAAQS
jgi:hypothetical protein